ncbi:MAG: nicotinate phosphoribosyltransferase [Patescibacteria group bacterium]|jgi:nicotinate phosphoribosyltransferase
MPKNNLPKTHLLVPKDLHLYELQNIYPACALWLENKMEKQIATYDLTIRDLPKNRNFLLFGGLEEVIQEIKQWKYTKAEINYLLKQQLATPKLAKYLSSFKFTGDLYAMPEGTAFFPGEPVIRITAPLLEGNLFSLFLMNSICSNTIFLSKLIRSKIAVKDKKLAFGGQRSHSFESGMKATRAAYIAGIDTGMPSFFKKYNIINPPKISLNAYHAVIKSFPTELDAMRSAAKLFPNRCRPMVDTYNFKQGIKNVIALSKELKKENNSIAAITIDSGDLAQRALYARQKFDQAGFRNIKITAASNLDEWKIDELVKKNIPIDNYVAVTELSTSSDDPKLEIVYKLVELRDRNKIKLCAKFAKNKISYPGKKQVFRIYKNNISQTDIIGLEDEKLGKLKLQKMISNGKLNYSLPTLDQIKEHVQNELKTLPKKLLDIEKQHKYKVQFSQKLKDLLEKARQEHTV